MAATNGTYTLEVEEFVHDLLSGLATVLALFGGQFIKEFLSMSFGLWEHVLLSIGLIGLLTIMESVIRVAGAKLMKVLIGKPREERGSIEKELLSSTSDDVCETWSGKEIVRIKGQCPHGMKTLVVTKKKGVLDILGAYDAGYFRVDDRKRSDKEVREELDRVLDAPPNLALNVRDAKEQARETRNLALASLFSLACAVAIPWIVGRWVDGTDRQSLMRGSYFHSAGTLLLTVGIYGCGYIMEAVTAELDLRFQENTGDSIAAVRLQPSCIVGDQRFPATAILNPFDNPNIRTSRWAKSNGEYKKSVLCSVLCAFCGFIVSVVGLRVHHWTSAVTTFALSLVMIGARACARRHLARDPVTINLRKGHELAWVALGAGLFHTHAGSPEQFWKRYSSTDVRWEVATGQVHRVGGTKQLTTLMLTGPLSTSIQRETRHTPREDLHSLNRFAPQMKAFRQVKALVPSHLSPEVSLRAMQLIESINGIADLLMTTEHVAWKGQPPFAGPGLDQQLGLSSDTCTWKVPIVSQRQPGGLTTVKPLGISLKRWTQRTQYGRRSSWRLAELERIEGILCFWLNTLAARLAKHGTARGDHTNGRDPAPCHFFRIVGLNSGNGEQPGCDADVLSKWIGRRDIDLLAMTSTGALLQDASDSMYFGMPFLSDLSRDGNRGLHSENGATDSTTVQTWNLQCLFTLCYDTDMAMHCAQELFSLFILAIAAEVSSVGGTTSPLPPQRGRYGVWDNTLLTSLAEHAVRTKLAANIDEALTLVVPAFAHYNLLPKTGPVEQPACGESEHTDAGVDERGGSDSDDGSEGGVRITMDD